MNGNTFNQTTVSYTHSKKVWREIERVYPAGGVFVAASVTAGTVIAAGTPVKFDDVNKTITVITASDITTALGKTDAAAAVTALGINGLLQDDVVIPAVLDTDFKATGTVVYQGAIYKWALDANTVDAVGKSSGCKLITFVY